MVRHLAPLVYYDRVDGTYINVGTGSWQHWLSKNSCFRYESFWGSFTACKEYRGDEIFWLAYRQLKEEPRCAELGVSKDLNLDRLIDTAKYLSTSNMSCWEFKIQTIPKSVTNSQEREIKAVRQWCIFYTHSNGQMEFMGACLEKEQALAQIQNFIKLAHYPEKVSDWPSVSQGRYEVKEELVLPLNDTRSHRNTKNFYTNAINKEVELLNQISKLRHQLSELQKRLDQEQRFNTNEGNSAKFLWN
ncbi:MAG TPA: hypothetical protein V6D11_28115 [Waterburya sp.]|jgi:hypothetical protein